MKLFIQQNTFQANFRYLSAHMGAGSRVVLQMIAYRYVANRVAELLCGNKLFEIQNNLFIIYEGRL